MRQKKAERVAGMVVLQESHFISLRIHLVLKGRRKATLSLQVFAQSHSIIKRFQLVILSRLDALTQTLRLRRLKGCMMDMELRFQQIPKGKIDVSYQAHTNDAVVCYLSSG